MPVTVSSKCRASEIGFQLSTVPRKLTPPLPRPLQDKTPLTCPSIPGEDGLTLDVTGTQLVEKDIENLARGEVKSVKWGYTVLGGDGPFL